MRSEDVGEARKRVSCIEFDVHENVVNAEMAKALGA